jgi:short-subunit dehydrogenase
MMVEQEFAKLTTEQIERTITLNITALTQLIHQFLPAMKARKSGRILNVASVAAFHPVPGMDIYAATKAYVLSFSEALAENLRDTGISVTALCPGLTDTNMVDTSVAGAIPTFMISQPDEVARSGFDALMNREVICIPGNANRLALAWAQHQPRWLVRGLGGLANKLTPQR